jgi:hypothetical protein
VQAARGGQCDGGTKGAVFVEAVAVDADLACGVSEDEERWLWTQGDDLQ